MQSDGQREIETERELSEQWVAGGTMPEIDEAVVEPASPSPQIAAER